MNEEYEITYSINGQLYSARIPASRCPTTLSPKEREDFLKQSLKHMIDYDSRNGLLEVNSIEQIK